MRLQFGKDSTLLLLRGEDEVVVRAEGIANGFAPGLSSIELPPGNYTVRVIYPDSEIRDIPVLLKVGATTKLDLAPLPQ